MKGGKRLDIEKVNGQGSGQTGGDVSVQVLPANKAQNRTIQERKKRKKKKAGAPRRNYEVEVIPAKKAIPNNAAEAPKRRIAAYCRVSTEEEEQESSFELQVEHYTKYMQDRRI